MDAGPSPSRGTAAERRAFRALPGRAGSTQLPGTKPSILDKTVVGVRERLEALGSALAETAVVDHDSCAVATALERQWKLGLDPLLVMGALRYCRSSRRRSVGGDGAGRKDCALRDAGRSWQFVADRPS